MTYPKFRPTRCHDCQGCEWSRAAPPGKGPTGGLWDKVNDCVPQSYGSLKIHASPGLSPLCAAAFSSAALTAKAMTLTKMGWADLRISRGLAGSERENLLACWIDPGRGVDASHLRFMEVELQDQGDALTWAIHQG